MSDALRLTARMVLRGLHELGLERREPDAFGAAVLVVAPHQDDEVLGCGGTIARLRAADVRVVIVFATDGATSHRNLMPPDRMRELRREEARAAAAVMGVDDADVRFLDVPNRELDSRLEETTGSLRAILEETRPASVFLPWIGEPPADHAAAHRLARAAVAAADMPAPTFYEYPVWLWQQWPWCRPEHYLESGFGARWRARWRAARDLVGGFRTSVDVSGVLERKRAALAAHRSQTSRLVDDPAWAVLSDVCGGEFEHQFFRPYETFRRSTA